MRVKVAIDLALDRLFDYEVPEALEKKLAVGQLLSVPFGHREARGFAMALADATVRRDNEGQETKEGGREPSAESNNPTIRQSNDSPLPHPLKPITAIVDETPFFSPALLELVKRLAAYTGSPIESVLRAAVPAAVLKPGMRAKEMLYVAPALAPVETTLTAHQQWLYEQVIRLGGGWLAPLCRELKTTPATLRAMAVKGVLSVKPRTFRRDPMGAKRILPTKPLALNPQQRSALDAIVSATKPVLLHGVTGSGKTEVYLQAIAAELAADRGAIVLVPEIALTPQTVQRFASRFGNRVAVLHSALSDGERYDEWHRIRRGEARVVVGPRSAVFAPVVNLGLIVVDEEHESSYKQEELPRYHARDAAVLRAAVEGAKVVLGSATPSLETWANVARGKYAYAEMSVRAGAGRLPEVHLVDMEAEGDAAEAAGQPRGAIFSRELLDAISLRLQRGEQTILFLNRRGYAPTVSCEACGHVFACPDCGIAYTYHRADACLRCHVCGGWIPPPAACAACGAKNLSYRGIGTQRAEAALKACFPHATVIRMDADSTSRKDSHDDLLSAFRRGEADVLLGTQMIAKGLDFPNVTLVGVLNADASLKMPDFRAEERTFQLLSQVAGRAGRAELPGEVFFQSHDPKVPTIVDAAKGDYRAFAARELETRRQANFPPFCHLAVVHLRSRDAKRVGDWADLYARSLKKVRGILVSDAMPGALEKAEGWFRWQVVVRAKASAEIVRAWRWLAKACPAPAAVRTALDVDAYDLL